MGDLPERVHPGVRPSRAVDDRAAGNVESGEGRFQEILHRPAAGLTLPTAERPAVVGDPQTQAHRAAAVGIGLLLHPAVVGPGAGRMVKT